MMRSLPVSVISTLPSGVTAMSRGPKRWNSSQSGTVVQPAPHVFTCFRSLSSLMMFQLNVSATYTLPSGATAIDHGWLKRRAAALREAARRRDEVARRVVLLDPVVVRVGDVDVALRVESRRRTARSSGPAPCPAADDELVPSVRTVGPTGCAGITLASFGKKATPSTVPSVIGRRPADPVVEPCATSPSSRTDRRRSRASSRRRRCRGSPPGTSAGGDTGRRRCSRRRG